MKGKKNWFLGMLLVLTAALGVLAYTMPLEILKALPMNSSLFSPNAQSVGKPSGKSEALRAANKGETDNSGSSKSARNDSSQASPKIPTQITYLFLFKRVDNLDKMAAQEEAKGKDGKVYRQYYKDKAKITDEQNDALFKVAKDCLADVSKKDS